MGQPRVRVVQTLVQDTGRVTTGYSNPTVFELCTSAGQSGHCIGKHIAVAHGLSGMQRKKHGFEFRFASRG